MGYIKDSECHVRMLWSNPNKRSLSYLSFQMLKRRIIVNYVWELVCNTSNIINHIPIAPLSSLENSSLPCIHIFFVAGYKYSFNSNFTTVNGWVIIVIKSNCSFQIEVSSHICNGRQFKTRMKAYINRGIKWNMESLLFR